jgi:hypothetical protein
MKCDHELTGPKNRATAKEIRLIHFHFRVGEEARLPNLGTSMKRQGHQPQWQKDCKTPHITIRNDLARRIERQIEIQVPMKAAGSRPHGRLCFQPRQ